MSTVNLVGIVGSLRAGSINGALARAAAGLTPADDVLTLCSVATLPLYNGDEEAAGPPAEVQALRATIRAADGIVLFSPEYNGSLPAVTKNVIDWMSRDASAWEGVGITMVTMSPGGRAGIGARDHFSAIMQRQAPRLFDTLGFGNSAARLDEAGEVTESATLAELADFLVRFADHCRS
jgi:NAD(P)H-dependent FMN reductase